MSAGLKPKQVASILNIGEQKLRYWRTKLDPNPHRSEFSVPDLLAFRIIQVLIEIRHFSTQDLEKFQLIGLFEWCHVTDIDQIKNSSLMINDNLLTIEFLGEADVVNLDDLYTHYIKLKTIVDMHFRQLHSLGCENWKKRIINVRAMDKRAKYPIQSELNIETAPSNQTFVN
tara:strand:- start:791 stop:1306 length:516 start_codon:yes stop_codon:yes gene_type:complete